MKNMKIIYGILIGIALTLLIALGLGYTTVPKGNLGSEVPLTVVATNSSSTATSSAATLAMASADYAQVRTFSNTAGCPVYLSFKATIYFLICAGVSRGEK